MTMACLSGKGHGKKEETAKKAEKEQLGAREQPTARDHDQVGGGGAHCQEIACQQGVAGRAHCQRSARRQGASGRAHCQGAARLAVQDDCQEQDRALDDRREQDHAQDGCQEHDCARKTANNKA